jgi:hypothetical protein
MLLMAPVIQKQHLRHTYKTQSTYTVTSLHENIDKKKEKGSPPFSKMTPSHVARLKENPGVVTCSKEGEGGKAGLPNRQPFLIHAGPYRTKG